MAKKKDEYHKKKKNMKDEARGKKVNPKTRKALSKKASENKGVSLATLIKVFLRGRGAYYSSGARPGVTADQWAMGRVNSFLEGDKKHDTDLR